MKLKIKPFNETIESMYTNHGHFHQGDAGLDLFIASAQTIKAGDTALIKLQLACESESNQPYLLMPRSSIAKTPLRLCNSVGLIDGQAYLDLDYNLDSNADVDMNVIGTSDGMLVEVQGTGEEATYSRVQMDALMDMAEKGLARLYSMQSDVLNEQS